MKSREIHNARQKHSKQTFYDISIVVSQMNHDDFKMRSRDKEPARLIAIKKGLLTLHKLELIAISRNLLNNSLRR